MSNYPESIRVCKLFERTSKSGNTYLAGRWGGARISILKSKDVAEDGGAIWNVMLSQAPEKGPSEAAGDNRAPAQDKPRAAPASASKMIDDEIPF